MDRIEKSVVISLDGTDMELYPFLPYILQDLWEIGSSPDIIFNLIQNHYSRDDHLDILDLGCGKGAVSVYLAQKLNCHCHGIDAMPEFITEAQEKAKELEVEAFCKFERNDIRKLDFKEKKYDIIILGSIGPIFGNYHETLTALSRFLTHQGAVVMDDGFIDDHSDFVHPMVEKRSTVIQQIGQAGMRLIEEYIIEPDEIRNSNEEIFAGIEKRCHELMKRHPEHFKIFENYLNQQQIENEVLETMVICATMLIRKDLLQIGGG